MVDELQSCWHFEQTNYTHIHTDRDKHPTPAWHPLAWVNSQFQLHSNAWVMQHVDIVKLCIMPTSQDYDGIWSSLSGTHHTHTYTHTYRQGQTPYPRLTSVRVGNNPPPVGFFPESLALQNIFPPWCLVDLFFPEQFSSIFFRHVSQAKLFFPLLFIIFLYIDRANPLFFFL